MSTTPTSHNRFPDAPFANEPVTPTSSHQTPVLSPTVPSWTTELGAALATRPSRASSIVTTRTRFSTTTWQDDARSIDIDLGGQYFRISRDGSEVTSEHPPPPYYEPGDPPTLREDGASLDSSAFRSRPGTPTGQWRTTSSHESQGMPTPGQPLRIDTRLRANILDPSEIDVPSPVNPPHTNQANAPNFSHLHGENLSVAANIPSRNPSYTSGVDTITVADMGRQRRTVSQNDLPDVNKSKEPFGPPLRRRNGVRLPSIMTEQSNLRRKERPSPLSAASTTQQSHSAGATFASEQDNSEVPRSPSFIGRAATGVFPLPTIFRGLRSNARPDLGERSNTTIHESTSDELGLSVEEADEESVVTAMDTENDISLHYTRMLRFIDREHRRTLHARDKELAELRERLNEVDTVYRQELRARDFIIDDLKKRLAHLEESTEVLVEKARNQVEDVWESRWKDRDFHLMERMRRIESDAQKMIERIIAERDKTQ